MKFIKKSRFAWGLLGLVLLVWPQQSILSNIDLLTEIISTLTSQEYEGRRAGTDGNQKAVQYLVNQLQRLEVPTLPAFEQHLQSFTIFTKMLKNGENSIELKTEGPDGIRFPRFEPIAFSHSGQIENAPIVFAGFGISVPESDPDLRYDDYQSIQAKDKIVLVFTGDPGVGNRQSLFRNPKYMHYRSIHYKLNNAIQHGAKGLLIVQDPLSLENLDQEPELYFNATEGGGNRFDILAGQVQNQWVNAIFQAIFRAIPQRYLPPIPANTLLLQKEIADQQTPFSFELSPLSLDMNVNLTRETGRVANVVGFLEGQDPALKNEIIVLGAHFDHLGWGGSSSMEPDPSPKIHPGADDNASGTALVLDLMAQLKNRPHKRSYLCVFFNAEELGLLGSTHFVENWNALSEEYGKITAMLNFDMIGRFQNEVSIMGVGSAFEWKNYLEELTRQIGTSPERDQLLPMKFQKNAIGSSDHASFIQHKIPALFFTTGAHEDYHRSTDTVSKIDFPSLRKIEYFAEHLVTYLDNPKAVNFDPDSPNDDGGERNRGYGSHLGCVPQFGDGEGVRGITCTRAVPGSPAEKAGIIAGDIIIQLGDIEIKNIYDLSFALKYYRPGDQLILVWKRGEEIFRKEITLVKR